MLANDVFCGKNGPKEAHRLHVGAQTVQINSGKPRIVIIEDEFLVAWDLQSTLRDLNFEVGEIASDAATAVDLALSHEAELLLVDVNLGNGPDGIEAVRRIQNYREVAVIFITAYSDETNLSRIRAVAPEALVLSKPVSTPLLLSTIKKLFPGI